MTFSEDEHYLLIYYQLIDNNQIRVNSDPKGGIYTIWDIKTNSAVKTNDIIKEIKWSKLNFPNSLNCLYQFHQNLSSNEEEDIKDNSYLVFYHNFQLLFKK